MLEFSKLVMLASSEARISPYPNLVFIQKSVSWEGNNYTVIK